jgi:hypothetical protein
MEYAEMSADNPRVNALSNMWYEFAQEHKTEIKERLPIESPWSSIHHWGVLYADYILSKDPALIELTTEMAAKRLEERRKSG